MVKYLDYNGTQLLVENIKKLIKDSVGAFNDDTSETPSIDPISHSQVFDRTGNDIYAPVKSSPSIELNGDKKSGSGYDNTEIVDEINSAIPNLIANIDCENVRPYYSEQESFNKTWWTINKPVTFTLNELETKLNSVDIELSTGFTLRNDNGLISSYYDGGTINITTSNGGEWEVDVDEALTGEAPSEDLITTLTIDNEDLTEFTIDFSGMRFNLFTLVFHFEGNKIYKWKPIAFKDDIEALQRELTLVNTNTQANAVRIDHIEDAISHIGDVQIIDSVYLPYPKSTYSKTIIRMDNMLYTCSKDGFEYNSDMSAMKGDVTLTSENINEKLYPIFGTTKKYTQLVYVSSSKVAIGEYNGKGGLKFGNSSSLGSIVFQVNEESEHPLSEVTLVAEGYSATKYGQLVISISADGDDWFEVESYEVGLQGTLTTIECDFGDSHVNAGEYIKIESRCDDYTTTDRRLYVRELNLLFGSGFWEWKGLGGDDSKLKEEIIANEKVIAQAFTKFKNVLGIAEDNLAYIPNTNAPLIENATSFYEADEMMANKIEENETRLNAIDEMNLPNIIENLEGLVPIIDMLVEEKADKDEVEGLNDMVNLLYSEEDGPIAALQLGFTQLSNSVDEGRTIIDEVNTWPRKFPQNLPNISIDGSDNPDRLIFEALRAKSSFNENEMFKVHINISYSPVPVRYIKLNYGKTSNEPDDSIWNKTWSEVSEMEDIMPIWENVSNTKTLHEYLEPFVDNVNNHLTEWANVSENLEGLVPLVQMLVETTEEHTQQIDIVSSDVQEIQEKLRNYATVNVVADMDTWEREYQYTIEFDDIPDSGYEEEYQDAIYRALHINLNELEFRAGDLVLINPESTEPRLIKIKKDYDDDAWGDIPALSAWEEISLTATLKEKVASIEGAIVDNEEVIAATLSAMKDSLGMAGNKVAYTPNADASVIKYARSFNDADILLNDAINEIKETLNQLVQDVNAIKEQLGMS